MRRNVLVYGLALCGLGVLLLAREPKPDGLPFDYGVLSAGFGDLLIGLGGFAITVLAVLLGLEALDTTQANQHKSDAHVSAVRHVAVSLAIASITSFVGASLFNEVNAQAASLEQRKEAVTQEIGYRLAAIGMSEQSIAELRVKMGGFGSTPADVAPLADALALTDIDPGWFEEVGKVLNGSVRRHFLYASVSGYVASVLILQSVAFLLLIRFPNSERVAAIQLVAVLGIAGMLFVKLLHTYTAGQFGSEFYFGRVAVLAAIATTIMLYSPYLRRMLSKVGRNELGVFLPLRPYYTVLAACLISMLMLAATFNDFGSPNPVDRLIGVACITLSTAFLLVIQVEQPMVELLKRNDVQDLA